MQLPCDHAAALVPSYLDGELSEAQAAPLRTHLLGCPGCREVAKEAKALSRWFAAAPAPAAPVGFAARVARRAFAGDPGESAAPGSGAREAEAALLPFVLRLTVAAAALLLGLAALMQLRSHPTETDELRADDLDQVWEEIYGVDADGAAAGRPAVLPVDPRAEEAGDDEPAAPAER